MLFQVVFFEREREREGMGGRGGRRRDSGEEGYLTCMFDVDFVCVCVRHLVCGWGGGQVTSIFMYLIYMHKCTSTSMHCIHVRMRSCVRIYI